MVAGALILNAIAAHAFGPYTTGQSGYDVSYPQCTSGFTVPSGSSFGIIGVNGGRPFSFNPCFSSQYTGLANSAYINTGYAKAYASDVTAGCSTGPSQAWDIGCSEADTSISAHGGAAPSMWWLDIETANSWSSGNVTPNRDTINGIISRFRATGVSVGIYSTPRAWSRITGRGFAPAVDGVWVPAAQCAGTSSFIAGVPVWLTQHVVSIDVDNAC